MYSGVRRAYKDVDNGKYEYTLVSGARVDTLYGHVIIKYKASGKLSSEGGIRRAEEQVIRYIAQEAGSEVEWPST